MSGFKKILVPEMAKLRTQVAGDFQMIVDDQTDVGRACHGQNLFRHAPDFLNRRMLGAELDQVRAAVTELVRDEFRRAAMQVGRVHEGIKFAVGQRFHFLVWRIIPDACDFGRTQQIVSPSPLPRRERIGINSATAQFAHR